MDRPFGKMHAPLHNIGILAPRPVDRAPGHT